MSSIRHSNLIIWYHVAWFCLENAKLKDELIPPASYKYWRPKVLWGSRICCFALVVAAHFSHNVNHFFSAWYPLWAHAWPKQNWIYTASDVNIQIYNIAQLRTPHPPQHCSMLQSTSSLRLTVQIQIPAERPEADNYWGSEGRRRTNESARLTPFFAFYNCTASTLQRSMLSKAMAAVSGRLWHILPAETLPALPQKYLSLTLRASC